MVPSIPFWRLFKNNQISVEFLWLQFQTSVKNYVEWFSENKSHHKTNILDRS